MRRSPLKSLRRSSRATHNAVRTLQNPYGSPFRVREFIPHDSRLRFGGLNHVQTGGFNRKNLTPAEITP
jgi:hypothetical protein